MEDVTVCSLASGSNGNIYYIEYRGKAVVVDAGISFRKMKNRAMTRHIDLKKIKGVFISHEHSDHVYGLAGLCRQVGAQAFMTRGTWEGMREKYRSPSDHTTFIKIGEPVVFGDFTIHSFAKPHDVVEPCSFRIEVGGVNIGVFTDIGAPCEGLDEHLPLCQLIFMESNYNLDMLRAGGYPEHLKQRIVSGKGHLSNEEACDIVSRLAPAGLRAIFLSHISHDNNRPDIALKAFDSLKDKYLVTVMSRDEASDIWRVKPDGVEKLPPVIEIPDRLDRVPLKVCF